MKADGTGTNNKNISNNNVNSDKPKTLKDVILSQKSLIKSALPNNMDAERFARIVLLNVNQNPQLAKCSPISVLAAAMQSAQLGLEPGGTLGQSYLIPYKNKAQFQIGYRGMIELCRRSGSILTIMAHVVHENDEFDYSYGFDETLKHKPALHNRGEAIAYYAYSTLKDGGRAFIVMSKDDVMAHAKKFSKTYNLGPWQDNFDAMAKKTLIKQLLKYLPVSVELLKQVNSDESIRETLDPEMIDLGSDDIIDVSPEVMDDNPIAV